MTIVLFPVSLCFGDYRSGKIISEVFMDTGILLFVGIVALVIVVAVVVSAVTSVLSAVAGEVEDGED